MRHPKPYRASSCSDAFLSGNFSRLPARQGAPLARPMGQAAPPTRPSFRQGALAAIVAAWEVFSPSCPQ
jgi:hypothetical protein